MITYKSFYIQNSTTLPSSDDNYEPLKEPGPV